MYGKKLLGLALASTHSPIFVLASTQIGICVLATRISKFKYA